MHHLHSYNLMFDAKKENLILVHAFSTNSLILHGLTKYLELFFHVYFIDLPGFNKNTNPNQQTSLEMFSDYVNKKINELALPNYILGGVSFGFRVINDIPINLQACRAILAIEPYLNSDSLNLSITRRFVFSHFVNGALKYANLTKLWNNNGFKFVLRKLLNYSKKRIDEVTQQMDGKVFFETAKIILETKTQTKFRDIPYILLINEADKTIVSNKTLTIFEQETPRLYVQKAPFDHFPENITQQYFERCLMPNKWIPILRWIQDVQIKKSEHIIKN